MNKLLKGHLGFKGFVMTDVSDQLSTFEISSKRLSRGHEMSPMWRLKQQIANPKRP